jgi:hypothetical protein
MITDNTITFYCVADRIVRTKSDLIENDMFYKLFVEAWNESINGNDSEMIKLLSDATCKTVTDVQAYSTFIITNTDMALINYDLPGYTGDIESEVRYPYRAFGIYPLHYKYPWLDILGFNK